jgi:ABC-2 type transport system ATP-binding protein
MNAIDVSHLRRTFTSMIGVIKRSAREIVAVDDVTFDIQEGELFGLLGPNGAGKTTTTKMLTTLLIPKGGTATIKGFDVVKDADQVRRRIGFIFGGERGWKYFKRIWIASPSVSYGVISSIPCL